MSLPGHQLREPQNDHRDGTPELQLYQRHERSKTPHVVPGDRRARPGTRMVELVEDGVAPVAVARARRLVRPRLRRNPIVASRLRHGSIMTSTPSTRRQLDAVALWSITARFSQDGRIIAEK